MERLHVSLDTAPELCSSCRMLPAERVLELVFTDSEGAEHPARICRHCLSEHAPELLARIEEDYLK